MKMIKKITSVFMTFLVMAALVIGSTSVVFAADKVDDTVKSTLVTTAEGLTDAIVQLKDEEIENYMSSGDDFTTSAMQSWQTSKDELGAKKDSNGETTVTFKDDQYTVTVPLKFEKADANFVYVFDSQGTPTSMSVDVQYGMGKTLQRAGLNTLMGIGTVFVMLILLSLLISLFRFIPNPEAKKAAEAKAAKAAKEAAVVAKVVENATMELPDAMVLLRLYDLYGYVPSMYLNLYDVRGRLLDYIFDSMSQKDQEIIMNFINNLKEFV